jgi:hypothetical protein
MADERTGMGVVELAILEALDGLGGRAGGRYIRCEKVLAAVEDSIGLARGYGYDVLVDLALPWKMPIPLVSPQGNFGGRGNDPPANPPYTEARLSPAGQVVLAAARGELAPVPVGLINGNTHRRGTRPPFRPQGIIGAVRSVLQRPGVSRHELLGIVGPPDFMTGCTVSGDLAALQAGRKTELVLHARVTITDEASILAEGASAPMWGRAGSNRTVLVIDNFPPYVSIDDAAAAIANRAARRDLESRHPGLSRATRLPVRNLSDESRRGRYWLACLPDADADPDQVRDQLLTIYGVFDQITAALPRPLAAVIKDWVSAHRSEDLPASLAALETAIAADHPYDGS